MITTKNNTFNDVHLRSVITKPPLFGGSVIFVNIDNISKIVLKKPSLTDIKQKRFWKDRL